MFKQLQSSLIMFYTVCTELLLRYMYRVNIVTFACLVVYILFGIFLVDLFVLLYYFQS